MTVTAIAEMDSSFVDIGSKYHFTSSVYNRHFVAYRPLLNDYDYNYVDKHPVR